MNPSPTAPAVHTQIEGDVLLVTIDHPPVNALNVDVRRGLLDACLLYTSDAADD